MQYLDKYFKDNLEQRKFEMKDAYWGQAQAMLEADEKRRRRRTLFWWGSGAAMLVALVAALVFAFGKTSGPGNAAPQNEVAASAQTNPGHSQQTAPSPGEKTAAVMEEKTAKAAENETVVIEDLPKTKAQQSPFLPGRSAGMRRIAQEKSGKSGKLISAAPQPVLPSEKIDDPALPATKNNSETSIETADIPAVKTADADNISSREFSALGAISAVQIFVKGDFKKDLEPADIGTYIMREKPWSFGVYAAQMFQPTPRSDEQTAIAFRGGLLVKYSLQSTGNIYLLSGLHYQHRGGSFDRSKQANTRNYRFGLELDTNLLRPSSAHTLSLPILLGWQRNRHAVETGLSVDYLLGVHGERGSIERVPDSNPPRRDFIPAESGWIVEDGFRKRTTTAQFNYCYRVNTQWSFGLSANYTFGGILKNIDSNMATVLKENDRLYLGLQAVYFIK